MSLPRQTISPTDATAALTAPSLGGWEPKLDRIRWWFVAAIVLILIAYGPYFLTFVPNIMSPRFKLF